MNNGLIKSIIFLAGVAVGSGVTYILTTNVLEQRHNEEIESIKNIYKKEADHVYNMQRERIDSLVNTVEMSEDEIAIYKKILSDYGLEVFTSKDIEEEKLPKLDGMQKTKYEEKIESEHPEDDEEEDGILDDVVDLSGKNRKYKSGEPYLISPEEFDHEGPDHDKISVEWYSYDQVLVDDVGNIMDIDDTVGHEAIKILEGREYSVVYVRNDWLAIDYEISFRDMAFDSHINND